jgi:uncharacterized SAM-dependent methyltransferase
VFCNINRALGSDFDLDKIRYWRRYNADWQQIEMYAVANEGHQVRFAELHRSFEWRKDEKILVEISRKFEPQRLQEQLSFFGLAPVRQLTDERGWFSVLLFKKQG